MNTHFNFNLTSMDALDPNEISCHLALSISIELLFIDSCVDFS